MYRYQLIGTAYAPMECMNISAIILAGGKASRLGRSKVLETIAGKSLLQRVIDRLAILDTEIIIATAQGDCFASLTTTYLPSTKIKTAADIYPGKGPLGGIYTGLLASSCQQAIVVGCDMPFLNVTLLDHMVQNFSAFDAVVPRIGKKIEPLCAVYSKGCLPAIRNLLESNELQISKLFNMVKVKYIEEDKIDRFDPEHLSFFNINTQEELEKAKRITSDKGWY